MKRLRTRWQHVPFRHKLQLGVCGLCWLISGVAVWLVMDTPRQPRAVPEPFTYTRPPATATPAPPSLFLEVTLPPLEPTAAPRPRRPGAEVFFFGLEPEPIAVPTDGWTADVQDQDREPPSRRTTEPRLKQGADQDRPQRPATKRTPVRTAPPTEPKEV